MDLISHHIPQTMEKLERAVDLGSSAACAYLANLLIRVEPTPLTDMTTSTSPDALSAPAPPSTRPSLPARQSSNSIAHAAHSHRKSKESLRATDLYLRGLEIELKKPVQDELLKGEEVVESGYASGGDEDSYSAEGRFFSLERALDLVVGVTDSHRFGILHAPTNIEQQGLPATAVEVPDDQNDELWKRSSAAARAILQHPLIVPVIESASTSPFLDVNLPTTEARRPPSKRRQSIARSYTHAASSIPECPRPSGLPASCPVPPHLTPNRKLQLTIAIHALYTLSLQAHSASPASSSAESHDLETSPTSVSTSAESYWLAITRLAAPYAALGGIGIKEGDELVTRAQHRLNSLRHQDQGANEPWRLAKHAKKQVGAMAAPSAPAASSRRARGNSLIIEHGEVWEGESASAVTIRPHSRRGRSSASDVTGLFGEQTPRAVPGGGKFHFAEEDLPEQREEHEAEEGAGDSGFNLSPPTSLLTSASSSSRPAASGSGRSFDSSTAAKLAASQEYPSPPETPPLGPEPKLFGPSFTSQGPVAPASGSTVDTARKVPSPKSLSPLSPTAPVFVPSSSSASSSAAHSPVTPSTTTSTPDAALPRAPSTYSFASSCRSTGGTSILSSFSYNPLEAYLAGRARRGKAVSGIKRVESSTSICTAPPDFEREGSRRFSRMDKGKGRAIEVTSAEPSSGFTSPTRRAALSAVEGLAAAPKTWLSRFWASTKGAVADMKDGAGGLGGLDRTRSSSAVDQLHEALERHEHACEAVLNYWGDREFYEDEEDTGGEEYTEDEGEGGPALPAEGRFLSPPPPQRAVSERTIRPSSPSPVTAAQLRPPPFKHRDTTESLRGGKPGSIKSAKSKRSFLLNDPTRPSRATSRNHNRAISSASSITTVDGYLAPPSPSTGASPLKPVPVAIDPLLLELERRSHVGIKTVCGACHKKGLNYPACRACKKTYCSRDCRVSGRHPCQAARMAVEAAA
ncbi:hypothetical protein JCM11251_001411 [Rhodosporidiobolus azoricus]